MKTKICGFCGREIKSLGWARHQTKHSENGDYRRKRNWIEKAKQEGFDNAIETMEILVKEQKRIRDKKLKSGDKHGK